MHSPKKAARSTGSRGAWHRAVIIVNHESQACSQISSVRFKVFPFLDVNAREWFTCTSRRSNHTVTCPVLTVTWTIDGY